MNADTLAVVKKFANAEELIELCIGQIWDEEPYGHQLINWAMGDMKEGVSLFLRGAIGHLRDEDCVIAHPIGIYEDVALSGPVQSGRGKQPIHWIKGLCAKPGGMS